jgi:hypothetical protein
MTDRLSFQILGLLGGAAEGPLAIAVVALLTLVVTKRLWWGR